MISKKYSDIVAKVLIVFSLLAPAGFLIIFSTALAPSSEEGSAKVIVWLFVVFIISFILSIGFKLAGTNTRKLWLEWLFWAILSFSTLVVDVLIFVV